MAELVGQWLGASRGTNPGDLIIELEKFGQQYEGIAYLIEQNSETPSTIADLSFPNLPTSGPKNHFRVQMQPRPFNSFTGQEYPEAEASRLIDSGQFPASAQATLSLIGEELHVHWTSSINTEGTANLIPSLANRPSTISSPDQFTWEGFRSIVSSHEHYRFIYRGQQHSDWRLRTHFHRSGRFNLHSYTKRHLPIVHQHITPHTNVFLDRDNARQNGAFLSLAQHHGFPTPLLDWTYSPFVAIFFAFRGMKNSVASDGGSVRVFYFDKGEWEKDLPQYQDLFTPYRHFSVLETFPIENPRMIPQQALSTVTNLDDIESYIQFAEKKIGKTYLNVIDIPHSHRDEVLGDLAKMGITAGSIFPGLDGVCEQMKNRFFPSV